MVPAGSLKKKNAGTVAQSTAGQAVGQKTGVAVGNEITMTNRPTKAIPPQPASVRAESGPMAGVAGRKIAGAVGLKTKIPGAAGQNSGVTADQNMAGTGSPNSTAVGITSQNLARLSIGKRKTLDDLVDWFEKCALDEPGHLSKRVCGGLGGDGDVRRGLDGQGADEEMEDIDDPCCSPQPWIAESSNGWYSDPGSEADSESTDGTGDITADSTGSSSTGSDPGDWGSDWSGDVEEEAADLKNIGWLNHRMETGTFDEVIKPMEKTPQNQITPFPFVRCSFCIDTQLSILSLPIFKPTYRDDIRRLRPGVVLICGHMFCDECFEDYIEYHDENENDEDEVEAEPGELHLAEFCSICANKRFRSQRCKCQLLAAYLPINERDPRAPLKYRKEHRDGKWEGFQPLVPSHTLSSMKCKSCIIRKPQPPFSELFPQTSFEGTEYGGTPSPCRKLGIDCYIHCHDVACRLFGTLIDQNSCLSSFDYHLIHYLTLGNPVPCSLSFSFP